MNKDYQNLFTKLLEFLAAIFLNALLLPLFYPFIAFYYYVADVCALKNIIGIFTSTLIFLIDLSPPISIIFLSYSVYESVFKDEDSFQYADFWLLNSYLLFIFFSFSHAYFYVFFDDWNQDFRLSNFTDQSYLNSIGLGRIRHFFKLNNGNKYRKIDENITQINYDFLDDAQFIQFDEFKHQIFYPICFKLKLEPSILFFNEMSDESQEYPTDITLSQGQIDTLKRYYGRAQKSISYDMVYKIYQICYDRYSRPMSIDVCKLFFFITIKVLIPGLYIELMSNNNLKMQGWMIILQTFFYIHISMCMANVATNQDLKKQNLILKLTNQCINFLDNEEDNTQIDATCPLRYMIYLGIILSLYGWSAAQHIFYHIKSQSDKKYVTTFLILIFYLLFQIFMFFTFIYDSTNQKPLKLQSKKDFFEVQESINFILIIFILLSRISQIISFNINKKKQQKLLIHLNSLFNQTKHLQNIIFEKNFINGIQDIQHKKIIHSIQIKLDYFRKGNQNGQELLQLRGTMINNLQAELQEIIEELQKQLNEQANLFNVIPINHYYFGLFVFLLIIIVLPKIITNIYLNMAL